MTKINLQTEIERRLYVEALFQCLDRHLITEQDACQDLTAILLSLTELKFSGLEERTLVRRVTGVVRAYHTGIIDRLAARASFEGLLDAAARNDFAFFRDSRVLNDA